MARFATVERDRPLPSIERALSGPGSRGDTSWNRQVKVVTGGQGPGKRDQETLGRHAFRFHLAPQFFEQNPLMSRVLID